MSLPLPCPVCRAANDQGPSCRRCRADLTVLFSLERQRDHWLQLARQAARRGDVETARERAARAHELRADEQSRGALAAACLLGRDFAGAYRFSRALASGVA